MRKLDLMSVETNDLDCNKGTHVQYGLLGFVIGLVADIDVESEHLRRLGQTIRTHVYAVKRIASLRSYDMTVSYLPCKSNASAAEEYDEKGKENVTSSKSPSPTSDEDRSAMNNVPTSSELEDSKDLSEKCFLSNDLLVPLNEPVPSNWTVVKSGFVQVSGLGISHLSQDVVIHPNLRLCDGFMMLGMVKDSATRRNIMTYWDSFEKGQGLSEASSPGNAVVAPCKAFRIEPHSKHSGIITLDGERLPYGPFQCQVHMGLARVFAEEDQK